MFWVLRVSRHLTHCSSKDAARTFKTNHLFSTMKEPTLEARAGLQNQNHTFADNVIKT
jgi:hypothetical protein